MVQRRFTQRAVRRFMPGEDVSSALDAAERLRDARMATVLTRLGENVADRDQAREVADHYVDALGRIEERSLPCHLSVKLTQLGLDMSRDACEHELRRILTGATRFDNFVWIDMEGSAYTDVTLTVFRSVRADYSNVGVCLQAYLRRTAADYDELTGLQPVIRLVKGAYREPPSVAFPRKADVDREFLELGQRLLRTATEDSGTAPGIATHDTSLIARIQRFAQANDIPPDRYEFQMLYGIGRDDQLRLVEAGNRVRVLISYGEAWFPWYMRRLAERPANLWFVMKSLVAS